MKCTAQQLKLYTTCSAEERSAFIYHFIAILSWPGVDLSFDLADPPKIVSVYICNQKKTVTDSDIIIRLSFKIMM